MLLPILFLTPSRAIVNVLTTPANQQLRLPRTTTVYTSIAAFLRLLVQPLRRRIRTTFNTWHSEKWTDGDTSDERCRRRPLLFLRERCADVLPFAAAAQGDIFGFQRQWDQIFGQKFAVRTMLPRPTPLRQSRQESLTGCDPVALSAVPCKASPRRSPPTFS